MTFSHLATGKACPICFMNFFKGNGQKKTQVSGTLRMQEEEKKRGGGGKGLVEIPLYFCLSLEGIALKLVSPSSGQAAIIGIYVCVHCKDSVLQECVR